MFYNERCSPLQTHTHTAHWQFGNDDRCAPPQLNSPRRCSSPGGRPRLDARQLGRRGQRRGASGRHARALHAIPPRVAATAPPPPRVVAAPRVAATAARVATPKSAASPYSEGLRQSEGLQLILPAACAIGAGGIVYSAARWQDPIVEQWGGRTRRRVNAVYSYVAGTIAGCVFVSVT